MTSPTGAWTNIEQHGPTFEITDARNKINDLQSQADRLQFSSNKGTKKRYNELRRQIAYATEQLAKAYKNMADHLLFNVDEIRREVSQHDI